MYSHQDLNIPTLRLGINLLGKFQLKEVVLFPRGIRIIFPDNLSKEAFKSTRDKLRKTLKRKFPLFNNAFYKVTNEKFELKPEDLKAPFSTRTFTITLLDKDKGDLDKVKSLWPAFENIFLNVSWNIVDFTPPNPEEIYLTGDGSNPSSSQNDNHHNSDNRPRKRRKVDEGHQSTLSFAPTHDADLQCGDSISLQADTEQNLTRQPASSVSDNEETERVLNNKLLTKFHAQSFSLLDNGIKFTFSKTLTSIGFNRQTSNLRKNIKAREHYLLIIFLFVLENNFEKSMKPIHMKESASKSTFSIEFLHMRKATPEQFKKIWPILRSIILDSKNTIKDNDSFIKIFLELTSRSKNNPYLRQCLLDIVRDMENGRSKIELLNILGVKESQETPCTYILPREIFTAHQQNLSLPVPHQNQTQEEMEVELMQTTSTLLDTSGVQRQAKGEARLITLLGLFATPSVQTQEEIEEMYAFAYLQEYGV